MENRLHSQLKEHATPLALILILWILAITITNPSGSFPLNDDWNYARTVKSLLEEHKFLITQWSLAASLTHTLVGYLVCIPFGFSFEALRTSTAVFGYATAVFAYFVCLQTGASRAVSALLAIVLCCNPLFFNLALTFMTDVPFLALAAALMVTMAPILRSIDQRYKLLALTTGLSIAVCLLRQTGLVLPIGFALTYIFGGKNAVGADPDQRSRRAANFLVFLPSLLSIIAITIFQWLLAREAGTLYSYRAEQAYLQQLFSKGAVFVLLSSAAHFIDAFVYLGLFTLPAMPVVYTAFLRSLERSQRMFAIALALEFAVLLAMGLLVTDAAMPLVDNVFYNIGVGPLLVASGGVTSTPGWPQAPRFVMVGMALVGAFGAGLLCSILGLIILRWRKKQPQFKREGCGKLVAMCVVVLTIYLTIVCVRGFFDRYMLFPLILLLPVLAASTELKIAEHSNPETENAPSKPSWLVACALCALFLWFSVATTHDYFSWNRARWKALQRLTDELHISAMDIDGGLEFNGWQAYDPKYRNTGVVFSTSMTHNDSYVIAFAPAANFAIVERYTFERWLPLGSGEILVLRRQD